MNKQKEVIRKKYSGYTEITIDHAILYFIPLVQLEAEIVFRGEVKRHTLYYNPITKDFDAVTENDLTVTV